MFLIIPDNFIKVPLIKLSENDFEMNYELVDERKILYDYDNINKIEVGLNENLDHFCCKAILMYILNEINHDVICDFNLPTHLTCRF